MKKDQNEKNGCIQCDVHDCQHNNCDCDLCKLEEIKVCSCAPQEEKEATMCDSYQKKEENE